MSWSLRGDVLRSAAIRVAMSLATLSASSTCLADPIDGPVAGGGTHEAAMVTPVAFRPRGVWISCDDRARVAYRVVPPALNPHAAFTHPLKVSLKPSQACRDLK